MWVLCPQMPPLRILHVLVQTHNKTRTTCIMELLKRKENVRNGVVEDKGNNPKSHRNRSRRTLESFIDRTVPLAERETPSL
jgi:hypothetical protein